jgi:L-amino acid N-acyltransferase YncA
MDAENILEYGVCGYKSLQKAGFPEKVAWFKDRLKEGLRIKTLVTEKGSVQGLIEYIPGEYAWRPVDAKGYMFIHCLFVGFKKEYKGKGYASLLLDACVQETKTENFHGVSVITRQGAFMAGRDLFIKNGFEVVDTAPSDFELLVKKFNPEASDPIFRWDREKRLGQYRKGLTIIRAYQCPYTVKNVNEIQEVAEKEFHITPTIITLKNYKEAQKSPCPFGVFCIIYEGNIIAEHPISSRRFMNIMYKELH